MQLYDGRILYSATDLNNFLACGYLTTLELDRLREGLPRPTRENDGTALLSRLGDEHETRYLGHLRTERRDIAVIDREAPLETAVRETIEAMAQGREIIYQAAFLDGEWMGRADFLRRVQNDGIMSGGRWGWHYEVADAKLARHTEPYFLLQLCYYSEHVARIQGVLPEQMYVILGDESVHPFRYADFSAYYREVKREFEHRLKGGTTASYPLPVDFCGLCEWREHCDERWIADDHLKLVANIMTLQTARLNNAGITTLAQLGTVAPDPVPPKMERPTFEKLRRQARLQLAQRQADAAGETTPVSAEFLPHKPAEWLTKGFALLPEPCEQDAFFDMEGDPYYDVDASLEYLFGIYTHDDKQYRAFWGCDRSASPAADRRAEKRAFEEFIDYVIDRYRSYPNMRIYHYASYEKTKLLELSQRHATREDEVDLILRSELLVDLYRVVRQSIAVGQPGYSIKQLEVYYGKRAPDAAIKSGDESILRFEEWLQLRHDPSMRDDRTLDDLALYNRYDCESTYGLREWLLTLRTHAERDCSVTIPFFTGTVAEPPKPTDDPYQGLKDRLDAAIPEDFDPESSDPRTEPIRPLWMARQMLEYHWREDKPVYWRFYDRCEHYQEDPSSLLDDGEVLVQLELIDSTPVGGRSRSVIERYRFPLQECKVDDGDCYSPVSKVVVGEILAIEEDAERGMMSISRGPKRLALGAIEAIVMRTIVPPGAIRTALAQFSERLLDETARTKANVGFDILTRGTPRRKSSHGPLQPDRPNETSIQPIIDDLDDSYLFIQGPPGSGKTYTGARLITNLLKNKKRIGVSANSHKAILNLLAEVEDAAHQLDLRFTGVKQAKEDDPETQHSSAHGFIENIDKFENAPSGTQLYAGTAWAICKAFEDAPLDYLFVDEAGQVSLPNAIAMSMRARNVVLLGDPLQLAHVSHTSHPGGVGRSALEHLLGDELRPVERDRGILLTESYRMNVPVCAFISDTMYDGRLHPAPGRELQRVDSPGLSGQGLTFLAVEHQNVNRQRSLEEAERIAEEIALLLNGSVTDHHGQRRPITPDDIIVVTPYNAQVRRIKRVFEARGGAFARIQVGTVDKFQGREAHVVFFSTAASSIEDAPRGVSFLFDRNRFNVAISRAKSLAVLISSPKLLTAACSTVEQARCMNAVLSFKERSEPNS